jgi:hypothetical protein
MYREEKGQDFYDTLKTVKSTRGFCTKLRYWNLANHNYSDFKFHKNLLHELPPYIKIVDGTTYIRLERDYFGFWFSDYIYFKNISSKPILVVLRTDIEGMAGQMYPLEPGETFVSNLGRTFEKWD